MRRNLSRIDLEMKVDSVMLRCWWDIARCSPPSRISVLIESCIFLTCLMVNVKNVIPNS